MMKKTIKIWFVDFWNGFDSADNFFIDRLRNYFNVVLDPQPDYLFYSINGFENRKYNECIRIYFTGENDVPEFNLCDYAIAFHHISFNDRYFRLPLYVLYSCFDKITCTFDKEFINESNLTNRKFCSFVVSNSLGADPIRELFFEKLSAYKKVDSGGKVLNNVGYRVPDKQEFIRQYKFNIAFENSLSSGYTTEKLLEPFAARTIPIYWGNPDVHLDFNKDAFICVNDYNTIEEAVAEIIRLDNDDEAYLQKLNIPCFGKEHKKYTDWITDFDEYICGIINQPPQKAKRLTKYGYARFYRQRSKILFRICSLPIIGLVITKLSYVAKSD